MAYIDQEYFTGYLWQSCKHESWVSTAKYLMADVPLLLSSEDVKDIGKALAVVFSSLPSDFAEFVKWIAEVRRQEDGGHDLSQEEKGRLAIKEEVLKQVQETVLFKHVRDYLSSSAKSCCRGIPTMGHEDNLPDVAATVCCQGAEILAGSYGSSAGYCCHETCIKCLNDDGNNPITVVSGTVVGANSEQEVDMLVPSSHTKLSCCKSEPSDCIGKYPASSDVLTALILALPPQTWSGIKDEKLLLEIHGLVSTDKLPNLLQEEVLHLRQQLHLLKRCHDNKVDDDLGAPIL